ncbi:MAG TPA: HEAT repeat domain-containing protein, partial [Methanoregula sp.]|nr:HEAT repeat domain-containing protein [Methanoregula sp.]
MVIIADSMAEDRPGSRPGTEGTFRLFEKTLVTQDPRDRIPALIALGTSRDPRVVQLLIDCCRDRNPAIRLHAIEGLQQMRSGRSVEVLLERFRDKRESYEIRKRAVVALAAIGSDRAIQELKNTIVDPNEHAALRSLIGGELE